MRLAERSKPQSPDHYQSERFGDPSTVVSFFFHQLSRATAILNTGPSVRNQNKFQLADVTHFLSIYHRQIMNIDFRATRKRTFLSLFNIITAIVVLE